MLLITILIIANLYISSSVKKAKYSNLNNSPEDPLIEVKAPTLTLLEVSTNYISLNMTANLFPMNYSCICDLDIVATNFESGIEQNCKPVKIKNLSPGVMYHFTLTVQGYPGVTKFPFSTLMEAPNIIIIEETQYRKISIKYYANFKTLLSYKIFLDVNSLSSKKSKNNFSKRYFLKKSANTFTLEDDLDLGFYQIELCTMILNTYCGLENKFCVNCATKKYKVAPWPTSKIGNGNITVLADKRYMYIRFPSFNADYSTLSHCYITINCLLRRKDIQQHKEANTTISSILKSKNWYIAARFERTNCLTIKTFILGDDQEYNGYINRKLIDRTYYSARFVLFYRGSYIISDSYGLGSIQNNEEYVKYLELLLFLSIGTILAGIFLRILFAEIKKSRAKIYFQPFRKISISIHSLF